MHHDLHPVERQRLAHDVRLEEAESSRPAQRLEVALFCRAGVERIEVVDADHRVAAGDERFAQVGPDEPRRARHEDAPAHRTIP